MSVVRTGEQSKGPDWVRWHHDYETPGSSLARRLVVVQQLLVRALTTADDPPRVLSMCAGEGRDALPVLAAHRKASVATLVELDPVLAGRARRAAAALGLDGVQVHEADAGDPASYQGTEPVDVLLACGVFGNIGADDVGRTIAALPALLKPHGTVIWTRGRGDEAEQDPSEAVRDRFAAEGFTEVAFVRPEDARFRVGMCRWNSNHRPPAPPPGGRWFEFR
jgi:Methyltransferase domain